MIPEGKYKARALEGEFGTSSKKGTPFVRVRFQMETVDLQDEISWDGYFTEATEQRTIEALRHCGCTFPGDEITNLAGLTDNQVQLVIEHEEWTNEQTGQSGERPRVAWVNGIGHGTKVRDEDKMNGAALAAFSRKMKGALVASKPKAAQGATQRTAPAMRAPAAKTAPVRGQPAPAFQVSPPADDSDIPF